MEQREVLAVHDFSVLSQQCLTHHKSKLSRPNKDDLPTNCFNTSLLGPMSQPARPSRNRRSTPYRKRNQITLRFRKRNQCPNRLKLKLALSNVCFKNVRLIGKSFIKTFTHPLIGHSASQSVKSVSQSVASQLGRQSENVSLSVRKTDRHSVKQTERPTACQSVASQSVRRFNCQSGDQPDSQIVRRLARKSEVGQSVDHSVSKSNSQAVVVSRSFGQTVSQST